MQPLADLVDWLVLAAAALCLAYLAVLSSGLRGGDKVRVPLTCRRAAGQRLEIVTF
jgi:hypothetical protein